MRCSWESLLGVNNNNNDNGNNNNNGNHNVNSNNNNGVVDANAGLKGLLHYNIAHLIICKFK